MTTTKALRSVAAMLVLGTTLLLGACSDDDDATEISATATNFAFAPSSWSVTAGEEFTIDFTNDGTLEHEWAVIKLGQDLDSIDDFEEDKVLLEVEAVEPGASTSQSYTIDEAGTYQVICAIDAHFDQGMEGALTVG